MHNCIVYTSLVCAQKLDVGVPRRSVLKTSVVRSQLRPDHRRHRSSRCTLSDIHWRHIALSHHSRRQRTRCAVRCRLMHRRPVAWSCPRLFTAILCSTAFQITVSKIYSECRTMQLGLFSRFQDSLTPVHWYGRGEEADRQINVLIKRSTQNFFSRLRKSQMAELIGKITHVLSEWT